MKRQKQHTNVKRKNNAVAEGVWYNIDRYYTGSKRSEVAIPRSVACALHMA
ncbi:MAG: hypothetical protein IKY94_10175 [Lachnospiraceae bacterium]|nr:hypothetical protein [Lachnospiraceae bacterium]